MKKNEAYYIQKLEEEFLKRKNKNKLYSLRSFAKFLEIESSSLGQILKGKRKIPLASAKYIVKKLQLNSIEKMHFFEGLEKGKGHLDKIKINNQDERFILDDSYSKVISEWEHLALLSLFDLTDFELTTDNIVKKLNISESRAIQVIKNLENSELIKKVNGRYEKFHPRVRTTEDVKSEVIREAHVQSLEMAKNKIKDIEVDLRDFSSLTLAMDLEMLGEAKSVIREFRQKMVALLKEGNKKEVFKLSIQFYPLTEINNN